MALVQELSKFSKKILRYYVHQIHKNKASNKQILQKMRGKRKKKRL